MGTFFGPKLVTTGLVACLDAKNYKSYPESGTAWNDLANHYDGVLSDAAIGTTTKGVMTFVDASSRNIALASIPETFWQAQWTVGIWGKVNSVAGADDPFLTHGTQNTRQGLQLIVKNSLQQHNLWSNDLAGTLPIVDNTWYNFAWTYDVAPGGTKQIYLNGVFDVEETTGVYIGTGTATKLGAHVADYNSAYLDGLIAHVVIYNRVLRADEIKRNFNALRGRFGI